MAPTPALLTILLLSPVVDESSVAPEEATTTEAREPFSVDLGFADAGLSLGNSPVWHGVRINVRDRAVEQLNGFYLTLWKPLPSPGSRMTGVGVGLYGPKGGALRGIHVGGIATESTDPDTPSFGAFLAGVANVSASSNIGLGAAGVAGVTGDSHHGVFISGLATVSGEDAAGASVAGLANVSGQDQIGVHLGGLANVSGADQHGIHFGGLANVAGADQVGIHVGGLANVAADDLIGVHLAGLALVAGDDAIGANVGGLAAVAGDRLLGLNVALIEAHAGRGMVGANLAGLKLIADGNADIDLDMGDLQDLGEQIRAEAASQHGFVETHVAEDADHDGDDAHDDADADADADAPSRTRAPTFVAGVNVAGFKTKADHITGLNVAGGINDARRLTGLSIAAVNHADDEQRGVSVGLFNHAGDLRGPSLQIGLLNHVESNPAWARWLPILNASF